MAKHPCMPFWTDAYLGDTNHLTTIEHGAYMLLLITEWRSKEGVLPDDDNLLARYTKLRIDHWRKMRPILEPFFVVEDGIWTQLRLKDELESTKRLSHSQSKKSKARWDNDSSSKSLKNKDSVNAPADNGQCPAHASPTPTPIPSKIDTNVSTKEEFEEFWKSWKPYKTPKGSKKDANEQYLKARKEISHETLIRSSGEYFILCETTDCNTKNVWRWLAKRGWEDDHAIPAKGNGKSDKGQSYSSQILAAQKSAGEQLRVREEQRDSGQGENAGFNGGGEADYSLLPAPGDIGQDTIPFRPLGDAQEDGRE